MDFIEKISLKGSNEKDAILDNDALSDEQKVVLYNEIFKKQQLQNRPKPKSETKLLSRVWSSIENLPNHQQNQARDLIRKIEKFPNLTINPRFEMVYKDIPQHGTNIIQLILNYVSDGIREILPGQDLFENIAAFNERLVYVPHYTPSRNLTEPSHAQYPTPGFSVSELSDFSDSSQLHTPISHRTSRSATRKSSKTKKRSVSHLPLHHAINKTPYSPVSNRTRGRRVYHEHPWKR